MLFASAVVLEGSRCKLVLNWTQRGSPSGLLSHLSQESGIFLPVLTGAFSVLYFFGSTFLKALGILLRLKVACLLHNSPWPFFFSKCIKAKFSQGSGVQVICCLPVWPHPSELGLSSPDSAFVPDLCPPSFRIGSLPFPF